MNKILEKLKEFKNFINDKIDIKEKEKASKKWDSIVEELRKR
mgnify:CR=1 FL=1